MTIKINALSLYQLADIIDNQLDKLKTLPTNACILPGKDFRTCVYTVAPY